MTRNWSIIDILDITDMVNIMGIIDILDQDIVVLLHTSENAASKNTHTRVFAHRFRRLLKKSHIIKTPPH